MKVYVDMQRCASTGMCVSLAPEVFAIADDGLLTVLQAEPPADLAASVQAAVECCPVEAITVED